MDLNKLGGELAGYTLAGLAGFSVGAILGVVTKSPPYVVGSVLAITFIASRALRCLIKSQAFYCDMRLSTYHIVRTVADGLCSIASYAALFALGMMSSHYLMVAGSLTIAYTICEIAVGVVIRFTENDDVIRKIEITDQTPWHVRLAYA